MAAIDFSLKNRNPDGNGKLLVGDLSPTDGSYTTESQYKTWIQQDIIDGTVIAKKAECDQNGNVIDTTYETKADANDLKNALDSVDHRVQNLEQAKGDYVPVDSDKGVITTPSGKGKWAVVEKLRGVTRALNSQIGKFTSANWTSNGATTTPTYSNDEVTFTATSQYGRVETINSRQYIAGHKYLIYGFIKVTSSASRVGLFIGDGIGLYVTGNGTYESVSNIWTVGATGNNKVLVMDTRSSDFSEIKAKDFVVRDLTLYFGSTVPTLAEIQQYYPWLLEPSDYGTSLVDSVYDGVKSEFVNIWDEEWEIGNYGGSGEKISGSLLINKNMIPVLPSTSYYFYEGFSPAYHNVLFYDVNGTLISIDTSDVTAFTTPSNCYFMNFTLASGYGNSYRNDITIAKGSTAVTYHHYVAPSTLSLPTPITLRSAGSVAEEYDLESGEKTNPIGSVDLGTLTWYYDAPYFWARLTDMKGRGYLTNLLCPKYVTARSSGEFVDKTITGVAVFYDDNILVKDSDYSSSSAFKTAMNGVMLYYELATPNAPTQLTPIQNPTILTEAGGTISAQTEEPIDGNFSVGFITL